jgi:hypothetical protein
MCAACNGAKRQILIALFLLSGGISYPIVAWASEVIPNITVQMEPIEIVRGPDSATDSPFSTLTGDPIRAYVANGRTWGFSGTSLDTLRPEEGHVMDKGPKGMFDACGAWLHSTWRDGSVIRGWYHAESPTPACNANDWITRRSIAYAESHDGGKTFVKPNYPQNQVITVPSGYTRPNQDDEGAPCVIRVGDFFHMYFLSNHHPKGLRIYLARSRVSDGGKPGTWFKYHDGRFNQPGIGGESSPLTERYTDLSRSWVSFNEHLNSYMGFGSVRNKGKKEGYSFSFSPDGIHWKASPHMLLSAKGEWGNKRRGQDSEEFTGYLSLISTSGYSDRIGSVFWLYYLYVNPGEKLSGGRYLVRRKIKIQQTDSKTADDLVPRVALVKYQGPADTWITTVSTSPTYRKEKVLGYLFTDQVPNSKPVYDCYQPMSGDHFLSADPSGCGTAKYLRRAGWIASAPFANSAQLYECINTAKHDRYASIDPTCEGNKTGQPMGYLAIHQPPE